MAGTKLAELISAEAYNAVIKDAVPLAVRLTEAEFIVRAPIVSGALAARADVSIAEIKVGDDNLVELTQRSKFRIETEDRSLAAEGRACFVVRFHLHYEAPEGFWQVFAARNSKLYTHPPMRDLIASFSARANLLVMPLGSVSVLQVYRKPDAMA